MKCDRCGITIPELPEDASYEEKLCDRCYEEYIKEEKKEKDREDELSWNRISNN